MNFADLHNFSHYSCVSDCSFDSQTNSSYSSEKPGCSDKPHEHCSHNYDKLGYGSDFQTNHICIFEVSSSKSVLQNGTQNYKQNSMYNIQGSIPKCIFESSICTLACKQNYYVSNAISSSQKSICTQNSNTSIPIPIINQSINDYDFAISAGGQSSYLFTCVSNLQPSASTYNFNEVSNVHRLQLAICKQNPHISTHAEILQTQTCKLNHSSDKSYIHTPPHKYNINHNSNNHKNWSIHKLLNILYRIHKNRKKLVISFPGQSSQFLNMGMDFYAKDEDARKIIDMADGHVKKFYGWSILNVICNDEKSLNDTTYSQICIFVVSIAIFAAFINDIAADIDKKNSNFDFDCSSELDAEVVDRAFKSDAFENNLCKFKIDFFNDLKFDRLNSNKQNSGDSNFGDAESNKENIHSTNTSMNSDMNLDMNTELNARDMLSIIVNIVKQSNFAQNSSKKNHAIYEIFSFMKFLNDIRLFRASVVSSIKNSLTNFAKSAENSPQSNAKEKEYGQDILHNLLSAFDGIQHLIKKIFDTIVNINSSSISSSNNSSNLDTNSSSDSSNSHTSSDIKGHTNLNSKICTILNDTHKSYESCFLKNLDDYFAFFSSIEGKKNLFCENYTEHKNDNTKDHTQCHVQSTQDDKQSNRYNSTQGKSQSFYNFLLNFEVFFCGHSLGEYSALCAAGVLNFFDCIDILNKRSYLMSKAEEGGMVAVIGSDEAADKLVDHGSKFGVCIKANQNCKGQVVLSGSFNAMDEVVKFAAEIGVRVIRLNVSGAFHSSLMSSAQNSLQSVLKSKAFKNPLSVFFSSSTYRNDVMFFGKEIKEGIYNQMTYGVNWKKLMNSVVNDEFGRNDERFMNRLENALISILGDELKFDELSDDCLKNDVLNCCNDLEKVRYDKVQDEDKRYQNTYEKNIQNENIQNKKPLFIEIGPGKVLSGFAKKHGYDNFNFSLNSEELSDVL